MEEVPGINVNDISDRMVLVGGPPRSGTTFAARSLNLHPDIMTFIDDHRYECWTLYYYKTRTGLVRQMRENKVLAEDIRKIIFKRMIKENHFWGIASSEKTAPFPLAPIPIRSDSPPTKQDLKLIRRNVPLRFFHNGMYLCLKSPEISFVLPQLAQALAKARFVIVYRPLIEIAESMFRKGNEVKMPIFHNRWNLERDINGELIPPPGVPGYWHELWKRGSDFYRCILYAASYTGALIEGINKISPKRVFVYNHLDLRKEPLQVFANLADFLGVDSSGFNYAVSELQKTDPEIEPGLKSEYERIESRLNLKTLAAGMESLNSFKV